MLENFEDFSIVSFDDIVIKGKFLRGKNKKIIFFVKNFSASAKDNEEKLRYFIDNGWNIIYCYNRGEREIPCDFFSYGKYERKDLEKIIEWSNINFKNINKKILYGEKTGAFVVSAYFDYKDDFDFVVLENCWTTYIDSIKLKFNVPKFAQEIIDNLFDNFFDLCYKFFKIDIYQIAPIYAIMRQDKEVLFYATEPKFTFLHKQIMDFRSHKNHKTHLISKIDEIEKF